MEKSPLYQELRSEVERVMQTVVQEELAPRNQNTGSCIRAAAWNIERGTQLTGILEVLESHPRLRGSDVLLLTELDLGMARSGNRFIAREIATRLGLNYAFANCYISLVKGSGLEYDIDGENSLALHGNALFSRHPIRSAHAIALPNGKDKMVGKEKRLGYQQTVLGIIEHPDGPFWAVSLHLDAHSTQRHRHRQMCIVLDHLKRLEPELPILIGGDWNTSTYNSKRAIYSILGYWRRVMMGVKHVIRNHYPYPDRWFERKLFRELEARGYDYRSLNEPGACTLHYDVDDIAINTNMGDWVPAWCFWFIRWALQRAEGKCSLKLDWFAGKGVRSRRESPPRVLSEIHDRTDPLSDHDPIVLDFHF
jgi:endonuclease/exonuclease/phosphatase family metal-dependent hydrolase